MSVVKLGVLKTGGLVSEVEIVGIVSILLAKIRLCISVLLKIYFY